MSNDWLLETGLVLFVENYEACVDFYRNVLELPLIKDQGDIIILGFGAGYLMVEPGGTARSTKSRAENPTILRFNVADVETVARKLRARGVTVDVQTNPWGITGLFHDPDGNACQLRNHFDGTFAPKA